MNIKTISVTRKRAFASLLMPFWIVVSNDGKEQFMQSHWLSKDLCDHDIFGHPIPRIDISELDRIGIRIKAGQSIDVPIYEDAVSVFVLTFGGSISNEVFIDDIKDAITIKTKGGFKTVSYPYIEV